VEVGGTAELLKRIQGPDHDRLAADIRRNFERRGGPEKLVISRYASNPAYEGQTLAQVSKALGTRPEETAMELLVKAGGGGASLVSFNMAEGDIEYIMKQPFTMTCTDGDLVPFNDLLHIVSDPFVARPDHDRYAEPAPDTFGPYQTFCGT